MITTNNERDLPPAFLRRCAVLDLPEPDPEELAKIAHYHFDDQAKKNTKLYKAVADKFIAIRKQAKGTRRPPGTSEYLDAIRACMKLRITPRNKVWQQVELATLVKDTKPNG